METHSSQFEDASDVVDRLGWLACVKINSIYIHLYSQSSCETSNSLPLLEMC